MASFVGKKYKLEKSENFDEYMKELGVGLVLRKMGNSISPTVEVTLEGDTYTMTTTSTFKTSAISFKLGEEFDEETLDGRQVKSIITLDGNKLTQEQKGDKPSTIVREFTDTDLTTTLTIGAVKSVRVYKAV
ncbi:GL12263 [Drosophila persimilis]|uniref:Fatty acid-binding protein, muscle n=2 Tax=pseudoobscura subgroup TaxID=32358 RepID=A0A6I8VNW5_DROPS|nr:probable fatty acid-binding protein [Drosophila persimilis]XP_017141863.1 probable fatty acid-binding protein [Drosophila miranda]XP_033232722.1 probable fatty acid-binding protein [Drosophila pseudoobscura]EDW38020.1 GL12263 [Drosophila persimilis]